MAKNFGTKSPIPLIGNPQGVPISLHAPTRQAPKAATVLIDWASYGVVPSSFAPVQKTVVISAAGNGAFVVPLDYTWDGAQVEVVGSGSGAFTATGGAGGDGGGGGAYAKVLEPKLLGGQTLFYNLAPQGPAAPAPVATGVNWLNFLGVNIAPTTTFEGVLAEGGRAGGLGGRSASSIGDVVFNGGNGGGATRAGAGGGGAAGPHGNGGNSGTTPAADTGGSGGGGADGGGTSPNATTTTGGVGGTSRLGAAGGAGGIPPGGNGQLAVGSTGAGGGGGASGTGGLNGGNGGNRTSETATAVTDTATGISYGFCSGSGGGGFTAALNGRGGDGGTGGTIWGGAGGAGGGRFAAPAIAAGTSQPGFQGFIALTYYSSLESQPVYDLIVPINLESGVEGGQIDRIVAVQIDNTDSNVTVYLQFDDTGQTIIAAPGAIVYAPALTQQRKCRLLAEGFTNFIRQPITRVVFLNQYVAPQTDYEQQTMRPQVLGSVFPNSPVSNQQKFRYLAVGDLMWVDWIEIDTIATASGITVRFVPPVTAPGFYVYVTDLTIVIMSNNASAGLAGCTLSLTDSTGIVNYQIPMLHTSQGTYELLSLKNAQIKYPANSPLTFQRLPLVNKGGGAVGFPPQYVLASVVMNYSIVDERQAE